MARGPGKGVSGNPNGRPKGVPNKTTKEARELLEKILYKQFNQIEKSLNELHKKDHARYIDACNKLFGYILPRRTDVTSDDKPIQTINGIEYIVPENQNNSDTETT